MLTDMKIPHKLEHIEKRYEELRFEKVADVPLEMMITREHYRGEPRGGAWRKARPGMRWGREWLTAWFRGDVKLPASCRGRKVFLRASVGRASTGMPEAMLLVDGVHLGVFNDFHRALAMTLHGQAGRRYHVAIEAYAGNGYPPDTPPDSKGYVIEPNGRVFEGAEILLERRDVSDFVFNLRVLRQIAAGLDEHSLRRGRILLDLARVYAIVDAMPNESPEADWRPRLAEANRILRRLLALRNGPTAPYFGLIGHCHIDTAWLWPIKETWRKCARTFSSMASLMEQYPEVTFLQSSPYHAQVVRDLYPGIFKRMKKLYDQGRWEPNGAMYVEPDCNIPSGESLVRQILMGAEATAELFDGYRGDTLWMPDVFGYSAAMPQILRLCGIPYFSTQKISWNDTTRFPCETFHWQGIDGTSVLTHFHMIHCWPDPATLIDGWKYVQHKDVEDRRLCAFGYGDGGGGPHAQMMEMARRIGDVEGCPRSGYTTLTKFMNSIRDELGDKLPTYVGELYLECHRGTLTSIARIKRGNRRCEMALREAEIICTLGRLAGGKYPAKALAEIWKELLTSQFHDILPGSSIERTNIEAVATFIRVESRARQLAIEGAKAMAKGQRSADSFLLFNSLSWDRSSPVVLKGMDGFQRIEEPGVACQAYKDIEGDDCLAVAGLNLPALGALAVKAAKDAPFTTVRAMRRLAVTDKTVETPFARVRFDSAGRIASFVDKPTGRQVVADGGRLNEFLMGQDVPRTWDTWDIDRDHILKMRPQGELLDRRVVSRGPLQVRIRARWRIGRSTITQDMVFHATSPRVDFETRIDWNETHKLLKVGFDLNIHSDFARYEIQFGHVRRPTHTNLPQDQARFEVSHHKWADISDEGFGVTLLNDCKYGIGIVGSQMRLSLMKSATHPDARADKGTHYVTYSLLPHGPFGVESVVRPAYELNVPVTVLAAARQARDIPSLLSVEGPSVIVEAVKWAQDGKGFIVRLYEAGNCACRAGIAFGRPVKAVRETNLLEEKPRRLALRGRRVVLDFRAFEIKTLYCHV